MDPWLHCSALKTDLPIKALNLFSKSLLWIFSALSEPHPLVSAASAASVVAVLYLPCNLIPIFFSPVLLSTLFLLFTLLRLGSPPPQPQPQPPLVETDSKQVELLQETERCLLSSLEWGGWCGPLEIIHEAYEGEEEASGGCSPEYSKFGLPGFDGFCYSDSDMETVESPESIIFRWDKEAGELIEISLDEDNMFEIDLSACT